MMTSCNSAWWCWGLLTIWLCLGGVAFAEQINLLDETSTQDEVALASLAEGMKSSASPAQDPTVHSVTTTVPASDILCFAPAIGWTGPASAYPASTLRLHQQTSVYRI